MNSSRLCNICASEKDVKSFKISDRGYASEFDGDTFSIELCDDCIAKHNVEEKWFDNKHCRPQEEDEAWSVSYLHENEVLELIEKLNKDKQDEIKNCESIFDEMLELFEADPISFKTNWQD